jgi:histidinol phosphatase-like PHP family hydrolase
VEPVPPGTNRKAIEAGVDILAHPGLITEEEVLQAKAKNVLLEITARKGHSLSNGHVARIAKKTGAPLILNTDTHTPDNLITREQGIRIVMGAGLDAVDLDRMLDHSRGLLPRLE